MICFIRSRLFLSLKQSKMPSEFLNVPVVSRPHTTVLSKQCFFTHLHWKTVGLENFPLSRLFKSLHLCHRFWSFLVWTICRSISVYQVWTQESYHKSEKYDRPAKFGPEKDCLWWHWVTSRQSERKSPSAQVVETSINVTPNSPSQDYTDSDDHTLPTYDKDPKILHEILSFWFSLLLLC